MHTASESGIAFAGPAGPSMPPLLPPQIKDTCIISYSSVRELIYTTEELHAPLLKLKPHIILLLHVESTAETPPEPPSITPRGLKVSHNLPTTAMLSWDPLPEEKQSGVITGYKVQIEGPDSPPEIPVEDYKTTSAEISNLRPFTTYTFNVSAVNKTGTGPSATISSRTPEGGEMTHACC